MAKVLVSDNLSESGIELMRERGLDVTVNTGLTEDELCKIIGEFDGLVVRSQTKVTPRVIDAATSLRVVGRAGVGVDNIDLNAASKKGVIVMNTPGGNTVSTAEHAVALMMALARNVAAANQSVKSGKWERKRFQGSEVTGKTLGILGVGRVGSEVAKRARGLGMKVIANDPLLTPAKAEELHVKLLAIDEILAQSDFISLHVPLRPETKHMISAPQFEMMKPGVRIVNCARGGIIDEEALADAIESGKVAGAALDVHEKEPPEPSRLTELDGVIMTPHVAASTSEAQENVAVKVGEQLSDFLVDGVVSNAVNMPSMDEQTLRVLGPFLEVAERMGGFLSQFMRGKVEKLTVEYRGEIETQDVRPLTTALLKGFLSPLLQESVNYVNAPFLAKDRGIDVQELRSSEPTVFVNRITVRAESDEEKHEIAGTVFGTGDPRIVDIDDYHIDVVPEGVLLVCFNEDKPRIVGALGTLLGEAGINIANMTLGRKEPGKPAVTVLNLDDSVNGELMEKISKIEHVNDVREVVL
jgi:D-3-phosphoglycerate dehydrogenase